MAQRVQHDGGGEIPTPTLQSICAIDIKEARTFVAQHHYSEVMPRITKHCYGGLTNRGKLAAVATLGFGTRPLHTIKKMFPSLDTDDYLELGKLCLTDEMPRNSESWFIARLLRQVRLDSPKTMLLFSWADGIIGKPGYVYQASNFYYGGYIWTEMYVDKAGNRRHVRSVQGDPNLPQSVGRFKSRSYEHTVKLGLQKYFGLQFRYVFPLCNDDAWHALQAESPFEWRRGDYPKNADCKWKRQTGKGSREDCPQPHVVATRYVR